MKRGRSSRRWKMQQTDYQEGIIEGRLEAERQGITCLTMSLAIRKLLVPRVRRRSSRAWWLGYARGLREGAPGA